MHKVNLVVGIVDESGEIVGGYVRQITLPFVPQQGMKFEKRGSCNLWETKDDEELSPEVELVIYDLDEEEIVCLFTVGSKLASSFWTELKFAELGMRCSEIQYFRHLRARK